MPAMKTMRGVANNLAHHSQSSLSWLHPHLAIACSRAGVRETRVELMASAPYPIGLPDFAPLRVALATLRTWFLEQMTHLGFDPRCAISAVLCFRFRLGDEYNSAVDATITTTNGREYLGHADYIGTVRRSDSKTPLGSPVVAIEAISAAREQGASLLLQASSASIRRLREAGISEEVLSTLLYEAFNTAARYFAGAARERTTWNSTQFALVGPHERLIATAKDLVTTLIAHPECGRVGWRATMTRVFPGDASRTLQCDPGYDLQHLTASAVVWVEPYPFDDWRESQRYPTTTILWQAANDE